MIVWPAVPTMRGHAAWLSVEAQRRFGAGAGRALRILRYVALGRGRADQLVAIEWALQIGAAP